VTARAATASVPMAGVPIRKLTDADLPAIVDLAADRGWPPEESKWRLIFAVSEPFGVDDPDGGLAAVVVLTRYGAGLATIGMMLVASRHGRQGLGGRLMRYALERAGDAVVYLTATDYGRPLYERLGFRPVDSSVTYRGRLAAAAARAESAAPAGARPRRVGSTDLAAISAYDQLVFGADRACVLTTMTTFADEFLMLGRPAGGYGAAWAKDETRVIGPLVAPDLAAAATLISTLADGWPGPIRMDVLGRHGELAAWARAHGLAAGDRTALMVAGGDLPGDRARLYCPATVAIG
jgi:ribosomal protein S18 acetylase RimI-like enzyme